VEVRPPDAGELTRRLAPHIKALESRAEIAAMERLPAGLSGITYVVRLTTPNGLQRFVLKVAPVGVEPTNNRDVLRQARILTFLAAEHDVPVPVVLFTDAGDPPNVPPFYATEFVDGVNTEPLDEEHSPLPLDAALHRRYLHAAEILGRLHRAPVDVALFDDVAFAEPTAELDRWQRVFNAVPDGLRSGSEACSRLLSKNVPTARSYSLVHGDYRLGNTICEHSRVKAVIDWELWGLGDPRCDLAWLLHMSDPTIETVRRHLTGVPTRAEITAAYTAAAGDSVPQMDWFNALALYKRAAATALIVKHNRRAAQPDPRKEQAVHVIRPLLAASMQALTDPE
jgi:aminoglycoside phosphotransferase (APT) family kinase protein